MMYVLTVVNRATIRFRDPCLLFCSVKPAGCHITAELALKPATEVYPNKTDIASLTIFVQPCWSKDIRVAGELLFAPRIAA